MNKKIFYYIINVPKNSSKSFFSTSTTTSSTMYSTQRSFIFYIICMYVMYVHTYCMYITSARVHTYAYCVRVHDVLFIFLNMLSFCYHKRV